MENFIVCAVWFTKTTTKKGQKTWLVFIKCDYILESAVAFYKMRPRFSPFLFYFLYFIFLIFYILIFYFFNVGNKNLQLKVYRRSSFSIKENAY